MILQHVDFFVLLALAAFSAVMAATMGQIATARLEARAERRGPKVPWLTWLALGGGRRNAWSLLGNVVLVDRRGRIFGTIDVAARIHEGRYVRLRLTDRASLAEREVLAIADRGKIFVPLRDMSPKHALSEAGDHPIELSLFSPKHMKRVKIRFDSFEYELETSKRLYEEMLRAMDRQKRDDRAQSRKQRAKPKARSADPEDQAMVDALNAIPPGPLRDRALAAAKKAWSAEGPQTIKVARVAAAKALHPDVVPDKSRVKEAGLVLSLINAKLDAQIRKSA